MSSFTLDFFKSQASFQNQILKCVLKKNKKMTKQCIYWTNLFTFFWYTCGIKYLQNKTPSMLFCTLYVFIIFLKCSIFINTKWQFLITGIYDIRFIWTVLNFDTALLSKSITFLINLLYKKIKFFCLLQNQFFKW